MKEQIMVEKEGWVKHVEWGVLLPAVILLFFLAIECFMSPKATLSLMTIVLHYLTNKWGAWYLFFVFAVFSVLCYLVCSRYGCIRFAETKDEPALFSLPAWLGMIFTAGIGSSILYWAPIEWAYYYQSTALPYPAFSNQVAMMASYYGLFHWGLSAWAVFCIPAIPIAYYFHTRGYSVLRVSDTCNEVIKGKGSSFIKKILDVAVVMGTLGGIGTTLGLGAPLIATLIASLLHMHTNLFLEVIVMLLATLIFGTSVILGVHNGIRRLSNSNVVLGVLLLLFILIVGPTAFMINTFTAGVGDVLQNFLHMSFWTDPIDHHGFPQTWTIFYWAWWISWSPFVALFIARISRGRTMREMILGVVIFGSLGCWVYYGVFGNYALHLQLTKQLNVTSIIAQHGGPSAVLAILKTLPCHILVLVVYIILAFISLATSLDSTAYVLAAITSRHLPKSEKTGERDPALLLRLFWAVMLVILPLSLITIDSGLKAIQTASIALAFPITVVILIMMISFFRAIKKDGI